MRRPAWMTLREKLQPGDVIVVPRLDRLARNLTEGLRTIEELHAQGIHIRSLAEGLDTADYTVLGPKHVALCQKHTCSGCCPILTEDKVKRECLRTMTDKEFRFVQQKLRDLRT